MKAGLTLVELAEKLEAQKNSKQDFAANTQALTMNAAHSLEIRGQGAFPINDYAHGQIASYLNIPKAYYDRVREVSPELLQMSVNKLMEKQPNDKRFVRILNNRVRGFLSDRYRPYDNFDIAENTLPAVLNAQCEVQSCEITERRFYLKVVSPRVTFEISRGDIVQAGLVISNSEIGAGSLKVEPLVYRLVCDNGMIAAESAFRKNHAGKALTLGMDGLGDGAIEFLSDETRRLSDQAVFAQIKDLVAATLTDAGFAKIAERMRASKEDKIEKDPFEVVEIFAKKNNLTDTQGKGILAHLLADKDLSRYGLLNAVTRYSQDIDDYDTATDFERLGGQVLELNRSQWKEIAATA